MKTKLFGLFVSSAIFFLMAAGCVTGGDNKKVEPDNPEPPAPVASDECSINSIEFVPMLNAGMSSVSKGVLVTAGCAAMKNYWFASVDEGVDLTKLTPSFSISSKAKILMNGKELTSSAAIDCSGQVDLTVISESGNCSTNYTLIVQNGNPEVDFQVYSFMKLYGIPGISVSVMQNEGIIYSKGYGTPLYNKNNFVKMTPDHLMRLASVSKTFCAVCIMVLYERGLLKLDDTVFGEGGILDEDYPLPQGADERIKEITVRNLLQHNTGWTYSGSGGYDYAFNLTKSFTTRQRIEKQLGVRLSYDVDTYYSYFNMGYMILGEIVRKISGKQYADFLQEDVLTPMGIKNIHIAGDKFQDRRPDECMYYGQDGANPYNGNNYQMLASLGGLIASTNELMHYLACLDGRDGVPDLLKKETLDVMYKTINSKSNSRKALCWSVNHSYFPGAHYHTGDLNGTASIMVGNNNRGRSGAVVCNSRSYAKGKTFIYGTGSFDDNLYGLMKYVLDYTKY